MIKAESKILAVELTLDSTTVETIAHMFRSKADENAEAGLKHIAADDYQAAEWFYRSVGNEERASKMAFYREALLPGNIKEIREDRKLREAK